MARDVITCEAASKILLKAPYSSTGVFNLLAHVLFDLSGAFKEARNLYPSSLVFHFRGRYRNKLYEAVPAHYLFGAFEAFI